MTALIADNKTGFVQGGCELLAIVIVTPPTVTQQYNFSSTATSRSLLILVPFTPPEESSLRKLTLFRTSAERARYARRSVTAMHSTWGTD